MNVLNAMETLRKKFDYVLNDNLPSEGRFDNFGVNILYPNGRTGAEIRLAQLRFANINNNKSTSINLYYDCTSNRFFVRSATGRIFTAEDGTESIIMDSDFFGKNSRNKNKDGEYMYRRTQEVITIEDYRKLPPKPADIIETYARAYVCEIFKDYLLRCKYRLNSDKIKDSRPETDRDGNAVNIERYNSDQKAFIAKQVNDFIIGKRSISNSEENTNTSSEETQEKKTGTENL